jgi:RNA polymerase sigma factor (sigma-70 family)
LHAADRAQRAIHPPPLAVKEAVSEPNEEPGGDSSPPTRKSFLRRVGARDDECWAEFVKLYEPLLRAYIGDCAGRIAVTLSVDQREDLQQEMWIKLLHVLPKFELKGRFRTWLWQVTKNHLIDWLRREHGRGDRPKRVPLTPEMQEWLASDADSPSKEAIRAHEEHVLRHILAKVKVEMQSAHKWDCFEMHYLNAEPSAAVAEKLGLSVSAVNTYTSRVLARIRELRAEYDEESA